MVNYSYHGFTITYTGELEFDIIKHTIDQICNNIQKNYGDRNIWDYTVLYPGHLVSILTYNHAVYFCIFINGILRDNVTDSVFSKYNSLSNIDKLEERFINQYTCRNILRKSEKLQKQWIDYVNKVHNPDLYYLNRISNTTKYIEKDINIEQALELDIHINYIFNKYCIAVQKSPDSVLKELSIASPTLAVKYLAHQHLIDDSFLPDGITLADILNF